MSQLAYQEATCLWLEGNFTDCLATLQKAEAELNPDAKDLTVRFGTLMGAGCS
jgi:hypothetical protein